MLGFTGDIMKFSSLDNLSNNQEDTRLNEMKEYVKSLARSQRLDVGHCITWNIQNVKINLNPLQQDLLPEAIEALVNDGLFEMRNDQHYLTEKGKISIY